MNDDLDLTLAGIRRRYAAGTTPAELMNSLRQKALGFQDYNVFIHLLSEAELQPWIDGLQSLDPATSPLWGIPFVVKDNMDLGGIPTTAACREFTYTPVESAVVVQRLLDAGALPLGKVNLDQFATGLNGTRSPWGPCRNSIDPSLISGGSSAGSAVAVALGLASFSLGTDTAGSGRIPAGFNNLVGVKPTRGLLPTTGVVPACRSLDCVSIFALHADDANELLAVVEGFDSTDGYSRSNPYDNRSHTYGCFDGALRLGILPEHQLRFFGDEDYAAAYRHSLEQLCRDGIELQEIDFTPFDEVARLLYDGPWVAERYLATLPLIEERPEVIFPVVRDIIAPGGKPHATDLFRAEYRLHHLRLRCASQLSEVDALLTPTAGRLFTIDEMLQEPIRRNSELGYYTNFMNLLDMAAVAVPATFTSKGRAFGVTLGAAAFTDRRLLSIANRIQGILPLTLGASGKPVPALSLRPVGRTDSMLLAVCGAHLEGMPLNGQLVQRGATLVEATVTAPCYRLYALDEATPQRPALVQVDDPDGASIEVEVWRIPTAELGSFLQGVSAPLGLGCVDLHDGRSVCGFIAEGRASRGGARDITHLGGWRAYQHSKS